MTCPAIDWNKYDVADFENVDKSETLAAASKPGKPLKQYVFPRQGGAPAGDPYAEPVTSDLPPGETFNNEQAAAIGLWLMRSEPERPVDEEVDLGPDV